jgi:uncharacterized lipoprotein YajG
MLFQGLSFHEVKTMRKKLIYVLLATVILAGCCAVNRTTEQKELNTVPDSTELGIGR